MKKILTALVATFLTYQAANSQSVIKYEELMQHGEALNKIGFGTYELVLEGTGKSDIETSVRMILPDVVNAPINREKADFLMKAFGRCLTVGIDNLVADGNADEGDTIKVRVNGDYSFDAYNKSKADKVERAQCGQGIQELQNEIRQEAAPKAPQLKQETAAKKKEEAKQDYDVSKDEYFLYRRQIAREFMDNLPKGEEGLDHVILAGMINPEYKTQTESVKQAEGERLHAQSEKYMAKAEESLKDNDIEKSVQNLKEAYSLEKKAIALKEGYKIGEEDSLKTKIAEKAIAQAIQYQDHGKLDKAYDIMKKIVGLELSQEQINDAYRKAGKLVK